MKIPHLILALVFFSVASLNAKLIYEQEFTISLFTSEKECRDAAQEFRQAAVGDPNLKVVDIRYSQEPFDKNSTIYHAIIKCHVSQQDKDIARIVQKVAKNNPNYHLP